MRASERSERGRRRQLSVAEGREGVEPSSLFRGPLFSGQNPSPIGLAAPVVAIGTVGEIRTRTEQRLGLLPLPLGYHGASSIVDPPGNDPGPSGYEPAARPSSYRSAVPEAGFEPALAGF